MNLTRFKHAQADPLSGYENALAEIQAGQKISHWIWYIFPQLAGLGHSSMARDYAIQNLQEACDYLKDPVLGPRYLEITQAVAEQVRVGIRLRELMGSEIDALKLVSSLTLFRAAAQTNQNDEVADLLSELLEIGRRQSYPPCARTLQSLH